VLVRIKIKNQGDVEMKYRVIKDIIEGWETTAKKGEILIVGSWKGEDTLMKDGKAVCDIDSKNFKENCEEIKS
jgi:hypothetical protein